MSVRASADSIRDELRAHLAAILYCESADIADDATFTQLGLDSVLGVELVSLVNARYGLQETIDTIYQHPTLRRLTAHLHDQVSAGQVGR